MTVGDRIQSARKRLGMSQASLAEAAGVSQPVISRIERNETQDASAETILRIADVLQTDAKLLLFGEAGLPESHFTELAALDTEDLEDQQAILRVYLRLSPSHKRVLLSIARTLRESERERESSCGGSPKNAA